MSDLCIKNKPAKNPLTDFENMISNSANMFPSFVRFGVTNLYFMDLPEPKKSHEIVSVLRDLPANVLHGTSFRVSTIIGAANSVAKTIPDFINYIQSQIFPYFNRPRDYEFVIRFNGRDDSCIFITALLNMLSNATQIRVTFPDIVGPFKIPVDAIISWLLIPVIKEECVKFLSVTVRTIENVVNMIESFKEV